MEFKTDENVPLEAVDLLRAAGHDALSVFDQSLAGRSDSRIASVCKREERILITLDTDFSDIRTYRPADYRGLVVLRLTRQSVPEVTAWCADFWKCSRRIIVVANCGSSSPTASGHAHETSARPDRPSVFGEKRSAPAGAKHT